MREWIPKRPKQSQFSGEGLAELEYDNGFSAGVTATIKLIKNWLNSDCTYTEHQFMGIRKDCPKCMRLFCESDE